MVVAEIVFVLVTVIVVVVLVVTANTGVNWTMNIGRSIRIVTSAIFRINLLCKLFTT
ncbi:MAG: hypothetical protein ABSF00_03625 [Candidatus Bathyarchaeia archaeon]